VTRGGRTRDQEQPERRCIVSRESQPTSGLIRFVVSPEGEVVPDLAQRLPGRGIWVSTTVAALDKAVTRGLFARAAKRPVRVPPDLVARVEALLAQRVIDILALARKAGAAVAGLEKTKGALLSGDAALLIQARDGSARGRAVLRPPEGPESLVTCLSGKEMGLAFGRDSVIHAAMLAGGLSDRMRSEVLRLSAVREVDGPTSDDAVADERVSERAGEGSRGKG
jgi:predicted RNA-binding protein YlxR (DUF448 family)